MASQDKISAKDYPFEQIKRTAVHLREGGIDCYQVWTCYRCRSRQTDRDANHFELHCHCAHCGAVTDVTLRGCNFFALPKNSRAIERLREFNNNNRVEKDPPTS